jgi:hypothetical protein
MLNNTNNKDLFDESNSSYKFPDNIYSPITPPPNSSEPKTVDN